MSRLGLLALVVLAGCSRNGEGTPKVDPGPAPTGSTAPTAAKAPAPAPSKCQPVEKSEGQTTWKIKTPCESPDSYFTLDVEVGSPTVQVTVKPGPGYKVNYCPPEEEARDECTPFPVKLALEPGGEVEVSEPKTVAFDKQQLVMQFDATPKAAGEHTVPAEFKFAVCDESTCIPSKVELAFAVTGK